MKEKIAYYSISIVLIRHSCNSLLHLWINIPGCDEPPTPCPARPRQRPCDPEGTWGTMEAPEGGGGVMESGGSEGRTALAHLYWRPQAADPSCRHDQYGPTHVAAAAGPGRSCCLEGDARRTGESEISSHPSNINIVSLGRLRNTSSLYISTATAFFRPLCLQLDLKVIG